MNFSKKNRTNDNSFINKKLFSTFALPLFLLISAVVIIGSGCNPTLEEEEEDNFEETDNVAIKNELTIN